MRVTEIERVIEKEENSRDQKKLFKVKYQHVFENQLIATDHIHKNIYSTPLPFNFNSSAGISAFLFFAVPSSPLSTSAKSCVNRSMASSPI